MNFLRRSSLHGEAHLEKFRISIGAHSVMRSSTSLYPDHESELSLSRLRLEKNQVEKAVRPCIYCLGKPRLPISARLGPVANTFTNEIGSYKAVSSSGWLRNTFSNCSRPPYNRVPVFSAIEFYLNSSLPLSLFLPPAFRLFLLFHPFLELLLIGIDASYELSWLSASIS